MIADRKNAWTSLSPIFTRVTQRGSKALGAGVVVIGMALGVLLMLGLDEFTPHEHEKTAWMLRSLLED